MPGFLMGLLQFGWLGVNAYFSSLALASVASAAGPGLEYRFKAQDGVEFKWRDGKVEKLERQAQARVRA